MKLEDILDEIKLELTGYVLDMEITDETLVSVIKKALRELERFFDEKSDKKDTFKLFVNGSISDEYTYNIGEELFGINKDSFERLMFINTIDIEIKTNSSINSKLNTLLEGRDDTDLDSVISSLQKDAKAYKDGKSQASLLHSAKEEVKSLTSKKIAKALSIKEEKVKELVLKN